MNARSLFLIGILLGGMVILWFLNLQTDRHTGFFFGFAENQELELNLEEEGLIQDIPVVEGQVVHRGDTLMQLLVSDLDYRLERNEQEIRGLAVDESIRRQELEADIRQKTSALEAKRREWSWKRSREEAERKLQAEMRQSLGARPAPEDLLREQLAWDRLVDQWESELAADSLSLEDLKARLEAGARPYRVRSDRQATEQTWLLRRKNTLTIVSPSEALIGNIHGRVGEYKPAISTLVTLYEPHPVLVKAYVHEQLLVQVGLGDSLDVVSLARPELRCIGVVRSLGTRVVEIPERLRKVPELKVYGREILVGIPGNNEFLQKERVQLNLRTSR